MITPPQGVLAFVKSFGGSKHLINAGAAFGLKISFRDIVVWKENNHMPAHIYNALNTVVQSSEIQAIHGFIEFYLKGHPLGKFYLAKDISAVIRKRRI